MSILDGFKEQQILSSLLNFSQGDPNFRYSNILPIRYPVNAPKPQSFAEFRQNAELATPNFLRSLPAQLFKSFTLPAQAVRGKMVTPQEATDFALTYGGTSLTGSGLFGGVPTNAVGMGVTRFPKFPKKTKEQKPRDESSGHANDFVPVQFGSPAHNMNQKISEEFTPDGFGTFSADVGENYENLKNFISSSSNSPSFNEEVSFLRKLREIKGNPDAEITVYRASPTDDLRRGDLVTPIKSDADFLVEESKITQKQVRDAERKRRLDTDKPINLQEEKNMQIMENLMGLLPVKQPTPSKLFTYKVKAKDLRWDGNDGLKRWGYFPEGDVKKIK